MSGFPEKTSIIPPGVDLDRFRLQPLPEQARIITYVGRIDHASSWKGIDVLLRATARVRRQCGDVRLELVGGGDAVAHYARRAADLGIGDRVSFCGPQTGHALVEAYRRSSVVVLPSISEAESFGMALLEAMACGRPVIGSSVGGIPELVRHEETGLLVPPGDPDALSHAIVRLLTDVGSAQRFAITGAEVARQYSWESRVAAYRELLKRVAGSPSPHRASELQRAPVERK
jgi:glycosyltransferase involved in cell wall biosynthesis